MQERLTQFKEKPHVQERLGSIYDTFYEFPATDIDTDANGEIIATKFLYKLSPEDSVPGYSDIISGIKQFDGTISIFYGKGESCGRVVIKKEESGVVDIKSSTVFTRFPSSGDSGNAMQPAIKTNGKSFNPNLDAIESLLQLTKAKMTEDENVFKGNLTEAQEDKVMKWNRAMIKGIVGKVDKLNREMSVLQKRQNGNQIREAKIAVVRRKKV